MRPLTLPLLLLFGLLVLLWFLLNGVLEDQPGVLLAILGLGGAAIVSIFVLMATDVPNAVKQVQHQTVAANSGLNQDRVEIEKLREEIRTIADQLGRKVSIPEGTVAALKARIVTLRREESRRREARRNLVVMARHAPLSVRDKTTDVVEQLPELPEDATIDLTEVIIKGLIDQANEAAAELQHKKRKRDSVVARALDLPPEVRQRVEEAFASLPEYPSDADLQAAEALIEKCGLDQRARNLRAEIFEFSKPYGRLRLLAQLEQLDPAEGASSPVHIEETERAFGEVRRQLEERATLIRELETLRKRSKTLSFRLAEGDLMERNYEAARYEVELESASLQGRLEVIERQLFLEEFEKPV